MTFFLEKHEPFFLRISTQEILSASRVHAICRQLANLTVILNIYSYSYSYEAHVAQLLFNTV